VDTADVYSQGESEVIVGKALKGRRDDVRARDEVRTADGHRPETGAGARRRWVKRAVEDSLRAAGHRPHRPLPDATRSDPDTELDETLAALSDLVSAGKVRAIGCSTFPAS